jgi:hypothetical protein
MLVEIIGYAASALVAGSLLMVSFVKLRLINLAGAVCFVIYGSFIGSLPVIITNGFICLINIYHLFRISRTGISGFTYAAAGPGQEGSLNAFISHYYRDIIRFYPTFSESLLKRSLGGSGRVYVALKNLRIQGFAYYTPLPRPEDVREPEIKRIFTFIYSGLYPEKSVFMPADYITRKYRDMGLVGKLYEKIEENLEANVEFLFFISERENKKNRRFLKRNGHTLVREFDRYCLYVKTLRRSG